MAVFSEHWHRVAALRPRLVPQLAVVRQQVRGERGKGGIPREVDAQQRHRQPAEELGHLGLMGEGGRDPVVGERQMRPAEPPPAPQGAARRVDRACRFDVVLVRKLRSPYAAEVAVGSVDESGWTYVAPHAASFGADQDYIAAEKHEQLRTIESRRAQYTPIRPPIDPAGRIVIVVDDGLATGATMDLGVGALAESGMRLTVPTARSNSLVSASR